MCADVFGVVAGDRNRGAVRIQRREGSGKEQTVVHDLCRREGGRRQEPEADVADEARTAGISRL